MKPKATIDQLIINSPYTEPQQHWYYEPTTQLFELRDGRRNAGYVVATPGAAAAHDPGIFVELPLVNHIRERVKAWRENPEQPYQGVTSITRRLLEHWRNPEERQDRRLFFCQLEAIETLIWLREAPEALKTGITIPSDGGLFPRLCTKLATGAGKTIVMAMLIAWQTLNKVTYPQDTRFAKHIFVVAPGLTVKSRLQVLIPDLEGNYYDEFNLVPPGEHDKLRQGHVLVQNWHVLNWETNKQLQKKHSVDKRGAKSDEAYTREVLKDLAHARNLVVINDEAHHAWRVPAESKLQGVRKEEIEEATKWIGGLDRIHRPRGILTCFDFSATPFAPSGKKNAQEALFQWVVSDFGLTDAIESGLVKTPRVVIRDDAALDTQTMRSKLYHIYQHVRDDVNRKAQAYEPLPDLVTNAYYLLGKDWLETAKAWTQAGAPTPPVIITVANRTEMAARIKHAFDHHKIRIDELCDPARTLHIDSKVLEKAEAEAEPLVIEQASESVEDDQELEPAVKTLSKQAQAELLRKTVDTIGRPGQPGEQIQNVISVGMLTKGWDAKTVTHIMGLRAFSSQLLCEQVVGRGLRRTSYEVDAQTGLFRAEYVNIFGVPFTFLPHEANQETEYLPPQRAVEIKPMLAKQAYEMRFPNVIRIEHTYTPQLTLDVARVKPLRLNAYDTPTLAELAPVLHGQPDMTKIAEINLAELEQRFRTQRIIFEAARDMYEQMQPTWPGNKIALLAQIIPLVEQYLHSDKIGIEPPLFFQDGLKKRIVLTLNMSKIVQHLWEALRFENTQHIMPVFDDVSPIRSTADMRPWWTNRPCEYTRKSHISHCVFDSAWEASEAFELERNDQVAAWVKNDHVGFEILYIFEGMTHKYRPDFLIRLNTEAEHYLILETKGQDTQQDRTKREFLAEWVQAVNQYGGFGIWHWDVSRNPADVAGMIEMLI